MNNSPLIKTKDELDIMREGGKILSQIFDELEKLVVIDSNSVEIDKYAEFLCKKNNVKPAFKGYHGFPYTICANLNEVVVHGFPNKIKFKKGDIFGLDMGIIYKGYYLDKSSTILIGEVGNDIKNFVEKTKLSMLQGIKSAIPGNTVGHISESLREGLIGDDFRLMKHFIGHGIGKSLHEPPEIPGEGMSSGEGMKLQEGMVLAIESISVMGSTNEYDIAKDEWTVFTKDKKYLSALFEETVIVSSSGSEIITSN